MGNFQSSRKVNFDIFTGSFIAFYKTADLERLFSCHSHRYASDVLLMDFKYAAKCFALITPFVKCCFCHPDGFTETATEFAAFPLSTSLDDDLSGYCSASVPRVTGCASLSIYSSFIGDGYQMFVSQFLL